MSISVTTHSCVCSVISNIGPNSESDQTLWTNSISIMYFRGHIICTLFQVSDHRIGTTLLNCTSFPSIWGVRSQYVHLLLQELYQVLSAKRLWAQNPHSGKFCPSWIPDSSANRSLSTIWYLWLANQFLN